LETLRANLCSVSFFSTRRITNEPKASGYLLWCLCQKATLISGLHLVIFPLLLLLWVPYRHMAGSLVNSSCGVLCLRPSTLLWLRPFTTINNSEGCLNVPTDRFVPGVWAQPKPELVAVKDKEKSSVLC
jgi:hypothetical protein